MPKRDALILYVPALHAEYISLIKREIETKYDIDIYVWGATLIEIGGKAISKDIFALDPNDAAIALSAVFSRKVFVAELDQIKELVHRHATIIVPNDVISRDFLQPYLFSFGLTSIIYRDVFLRWDRKSAKKEASISPDREIVSAKFRDILDKAYTQAELSSDYWRQIGAVLFDSDNNIILSAYNHHLPNEYRPYTLGDPRSSFSKGIEIECSSAIHAEQAIVAQAAKEGIQIKGRSLYVTTFPCPTCAKILSETGLSAIYYSDGYSMIEGEGILRSAGIEIVHVCRSDL